MERINRFFYLLIILCASLTGKLYSEEAAIYKYDWGELSPGYQAQGTNISLDGWQFTIDDKNWQDISIPFFASNLAKLKVRGYFNTPDSILHERLRLVCEGIKGNASIYLNGNLIHIQANCYGPFQLELNPAQLTAEHINELSFDLRESLPSQADFPHYPNLFREKNTLGITRPLRLIQTPQNRISQFTAAADISRNFLTVNYNYRIETNPNLARVASSLRLEELITDKSGHVIYMNARTITPEAQSISGSFNLPVELFWRPERPALLNCSIKLKSGEDYLIEHAVHFGVRQFKFEDGKFYLNTRPINIRGVNYREDTANLLSANYSKTILHDFLEIKKLGFNAIRLPHYLPDETMFTIADSLGLMLFAELPVWRLPGSLYLKDDLLENAKTTIRNLGDSYALHPSFSAISIGQEIPVHEAAVQKFMLILKGSVQNNLPVLSYISPIPGFALPLETAADFYMLDIYKPLQFSSSFSLTNASVYALAGNLSFPVDPVIFDWDRNPASTMHANFIKRDVNTAISRYGFQGGFIDNLIDWTTEHPSSLTLNQEQALLMPSGFYYKNRQPKQWLSGSGDVWNGTESFTMVERPTQKRQNFFTITALIGAIVFYSVYRKNNRLRDNFKRAIRHSYGFYVDLRERRIIPLLNSALVGAFTSLILAIYVASFIYFYSDSFGMQEVVSVTLIPFGLFKEYLFLSHSPVLLTLSLFLLSMVFPVLISIVTKFFSLFSKERVRFRQAVAIGMWSGIPIILMWPLSLFAYHVLPGLQNIEFYFYALAIFIFWAHLRVIKGIRVLFITRQSKVLLATLLSYLIPMLIFWTVFEPKENWFEYLVLVIKSQSLF
jgi:hypothetical protein